MLRRQINNAEYIALSNTELKNIATSTTANQGNGDLNTINFVIPEIKMVRGYYATEMKFVNLGKIKEITFNTEAANQLNKLKNFTVYFEEKPPVTLKTTHHFIRWLGL